jgi:hypothetical protein
VATPKNRKTKPDSVTNGARKIARPTSVRAEVERKAGSLIDKAVERAVAVIDEPAARNEARSALGEVLREVWTEIAELRVERTALLSRGSQSFAPRSFGEGADKGAQVFKGQTNDIGFNIFTAKLITDTIDAVVSATIRQMEAYADLVANLAKTLWEFQDESIGEAEIMDFLTARFPDGAGGTAIRADFDYLPSGTADADGKAAKQLLQTWAALKGAVPFLGRVGTYQGKSIDFKVPEPEEGATGFGFLKVDDVDLVETKVKPAVAASLAGRMIEQLRTMAREGMDRIGITDGEIESRLTFQVTSFDSASRNSSDLSVQSSSGGFGISAPIRALRINVGASYSNLRVRAVNESSYNSVTMTAELFGRVRLRFRSEKFATIEPPAALPPLPPQG